MSSSKNLDQKNTSFLSKSNNAFIEQMYLRFIENDPDLPESWKSYFETLNDDIDSVVKDLNGPSWHPKEKINSENFSKKNPTSTKASKQNIIESIKAIALIRAYRIRGHLIANLDPLNLMNRDYIHELHPEDHGFKRGLRQKNVFRILLRCWRSID